MKYSALKSNKTKILIIYELTFEKLKYYLRIRIKSNGEIDLYGLKYKKNVTVLMELCVLVCHRWVVFKIKIHFNSYLRRQLLIIHI